MSHTIEITGSKFGITYGTDHCSFPSVIQIAREYGVNDLFHAVSDFDSGISHWGYLDINNIPCTVKDAEQLLQYSQRYFEPLCVDHCCFITAGKECFEKILPSETEQDDGSLRAIYQHVLQQKPLLVFMPSRNAGLAEITDSYVSIQRVRRDDWKTSAAVIGGYNSWWLASPGNCRSHTFSIYDRKTQVLSWHNCG